MTPDPNRYIGTELELFSVATHWKSYWASSIARWG